MMSHAMQVFAPTNYAFSKLKGAVPILLEPQNKALLIKVLEHHARKYHVDMCSSRTL